MLNEGTMAQSNLSSVRRWDRRINHPSLYEQLFGSEQWEAVKWNQTYRLDPSGAWCPGCLRDDWQVRAHWTCSELTRIGLVRSTWQSPGHNPSKPKNVASPPVMGGNHQGQRAWNQMNPFVTFLPHISARNIKFSLQMEFVCEMSQPVSRRSFIWVMERQEEEKGFNCKVDSPSVYLNPAPQKYGNTRLDKTTCTTNRHCCQRIILMCWFIAGFPIFSLNLSAFPNSLAIPSFLCMHIDLPLSCSTVTRSVWEHKALWNGIFIPRKNRLVSHFHKGLDFWFFIKLRSMLKTGKKKKKRYFGGFISLYIAIGSCKAKGRPKAKAAEGD